MTHTRWLVVIALLVLLALTACGRFWRTSAVARVPEGRYTVFVIVHQVDRTRLAGATVRIGAETCRTNDLGTCTLRRDAGTYHLHVTAPGYRDYVGGMTVTTDVMLRVPLLEEERR